jgi:hypothetical protein
LHGSNDRAAFCKVVLTLSAFTINFKVILKGGRSVVYVISGVLISWTLICTIVELGLEAHAHVASGARLVESLVNKIESSERYNIGDED